MRNQKLALTRKRQKLSDFLKLTNITKTYFKENQRIHALEIKELSLPQKGIFILDGKSGAGKTTLLNILGLLDSPDSGSSVIVAGKEVAGLKESQKTLIRREYFGFIFQNFNLIPTLSVFENIKLPILPRKINKEKIKEIESLLEKVGLNLRSKHLPHELSQGEQQRACIVRALINNPKVILADEPTSNLDLENTKIILGLLLNIARERNILLIISGNNLGLVDGSGKRIKLEAGKIID